MTLEGLLAKYGASAVEEVIRKADAFADAEESQPDKAVEVYQDVLLVQPDHPGCLYGLGVVLREAARYAWVIQIGKRITTVCPKDPRGWKLLATAYGEMCKYDESIRYAEKALECSRTDFTLADAAYAYNNAGEIEKADALCAEAFKAPHSALHVEAMRNLEVTQAYVRLAQGRWKEGFEGYRKTMRTKWRKERVYPLPDGTETREWTGERDAVVVVTGEQGLGDECMAASVVSSAAVACRKLIFDCDHRLAALFARSFPNVLVVPQRRAESLTLPRGTPMPTHHKTLFGLAEVLRQKDEDFHRQPFLLPNQEYVSMFRELFGGQRVIGLAWSGGLPRTGMEERKAGIAAFLPLVRRGEAEFVSLEYRDDSAEVRAFEAQHGMRVRRLPWVTQGQDMDLLAGLIASLSEVIGVGTTATHLSSAMGVPTTILVNKGLGWAFGPPEMLWYPKSTTLWRKRSGESWRDCVGRLVESRK